MPAHGKSSVNVSGHYRSQGCPAEWCGRFREPLLLWEARPCGTPRSVRLCTNKNVAGKKNGVGANHSTSRDTCSQSTNKISKNSNKRLSVRKLSGAFGPSHTVNCTVQPQTRKFWLPLDMTVPEGTGF